MEKTGVGKVRWRLPVVLLVSVVIAYLDRLNISFALPKIIEEYGWTAAQMGKGGDLIAIFFIGYGIANIFFSPIGEKYGPRRALFIAVVCFSIFTIMGAAVGGVFSLFVASRFLLGLGEGVHFPMNSKLIKSWFPEGERSRANGMWVSGVLIATIFSSFVLVPVIGHFGWRAMFLMLGVLGMLVTIPLLWRYVFNTPEQCKDLSAQELEYIKSGMEKDEPASGAGFWQQVKPFLNKPTYWVALLGGICNNFASYGLIMWFPTYFTEGRHLDFNKLTYALPVQYAAGIVGIVVMSWLGDKTQRRALLAGVGYLITAVFAFFAARALSIPITVALFSAAIFFQMGYTAQEFAILQRILPKDRVGTGTGLYNGLAMILGGGLGQVAVGRAIAATGSYDAGMYVLIAAAFATGLVMIVLNKLIKY